MTFFKRFSLIIILVISTLLTACSPNFGRDSRLRDRVDSAQIAAGVVSSALLAETTTGDPGATNEPGVVYIAPDIESLREDLPRIDGSIMTIPITEGIYETILGTDHATAAKIALHNGSSSAYDRLAEGSTDIIFVTYPTKEDSEKIEALGLELDFIPIARDGLVFMVNKENSLSDVPAETLRGIYTGKITAWKELGNSDLNIAAYQNPSNSYMQSLFLGLAMKDSIPMIAPMRKVTTEQDIVADVVASYSNAEDAIGFTSYYYAEKSYGTIERKLLAVDGIFPGPTSISSGSYPFSCDIYAAIPKGLDDKESNVFTLISWLISEDGQWMMERNGYVPLYALDEEVEP